MKKYKILHNKIKCDIMEKNLILKGGENMKKKTIFTMSIFSLLIMGGSIIAKAGTVDYRFMLPSTGYMTTGYSTKSTQYSHFENNVTYTGNSDYRIDFWGSTSSSRQTTQSYFYGMGRKFAYYANDPINHVGKNMYMTIKTGPTTFHEVYVTGQVTP